MSRTELALQRLLRGDPAFRCEVRGAILDFLRKYNPDQPRIPAGNLDGGQWTSTGAGQGSFGLQPDTVRPLLQRPSVVTPVTPDLRSLVQQAFVDDHGDEEDVSPVLPMDGPFAHFPGIRPLDPMGGLDPSAHPFDILAIPLALALYRWLSASNSPSSQAVIKFMARGYRADPSTKSLDVAGVQQLDQDQVDSICKRFGTVQAFTDDANEAVRNSGANLSPQQYGTAVHVRVRDAVRNLNDPNFVAEQSYLKSAGAASDPRYGLKNTIRIDVLENVDNKTVCVYDIKTGQRGLSEPRIKEIAGEVYKNFGDSDRIIVTEVRPNR